MLERQMIYLDNAAAARPCEQAVNAFNEALELFANPSAGHSSGMKARDLLERSRRIIAETLNAAPEEIIFTSGGTESNALALNGRRHVTASILEHASVRDNADELKPVSNLIGGTGTVSSCVYVCNENGAVQPIADIAREARKHGVLFHTDAVQAYGRMDCDVKKLGVDMMSVSAHKIGGIRGAGALYVKSGVNVKPLWRGGGQERGLRNGTEPLPLIAAFAAAAQAPQDDTRPLLGYTLKTMQVEGSILPPWLLRTDEQPEIGPAAYDTGAQQLVDFFHEELQSFIRPNLDPFGRKIIDCCLANGNIDDYVAFMDY
jgi:cysteine desulfurase